MVTSTSGRWSYRTESTYSVRDPLTPVVGSGSILPGEYLAGKMPPIPKTTPYIIKRYVNAEYNPDDMAYGKYHVEGMHEFQLVNGIPLLYAMGGNIATAGADPYTHTITKLSPGDTKLSRTYHYEVLGGTVAKYYDCPGVLTKSLELSGITTETGDGLVAKEEFIAQRTVTSSAGTNPAVAYTVAPALPTGSGTTPYYWNSTGILTHNTNSIFSSMRTVVVKFDNTWIELPGNTRSGTDEYSKDIRRWVEDYALTKQQITLTLTLLRGNTYTFDLEESLMSEVLNNDIVLKWTRSANDYILLTFDTSICPVLDVTGFLPEYGLQDKYAVYRLEPASVSCEVKDSIAGADFL